MELFYPGIGVQIGAYSIKKGIEIENCSDAESRDLTGPRSDLPTLTRPRLG